MSEPRVLQVVLSLNPGGTERLVLELSKRLGADVCPAVCCLDEPGAWASELSEHRIDVQTLHRRPGFHTALGGAIARIASKYSANVMHCHHYSPFVYGCLARLWKPSVRVVFTEHGRLSDAKPSRRRAVANQFFSRIPAASFAVSRDLRDHLIEEGFPARSIDVIYNGIALGSIPSTLERQNMRSQLGVGDETFVVGTVARLDPVKDLGTLIRAFSSVRNVPDAVLLIVGDGSERMALESLAASLGVGERTRFLGQRNDARTWLAACDAYVNSSISEGVSLTILEAMAAGLAVVATRVGGTPEVVTEECARLVPARDPQQLADALQALASDAEGRARLGIAGRRRAEERFSLDRMVREYRDVYERVA